MSNSNPKFLAPAAWLEEALEDLETMPLKDVHARLDEIGIDTSHVADAARNFATRNELTGHLKEDDDTDLLNACPSDSVIGQLNELGIDYTSTVRFAKTIAKKHDEEKKHQIPDKEGTFSAKLSQSASSNIVNIESNKSLDVKNSFQKHSNNQGLFPFKGEGSDDKRRNLSERIAPRETDLDSWLRRDFFIVMLMATCWLASLCLPERRWSSFAQWLARRRLASSTKLTADELETVKVVVGQGEHKEAWIEKTFRRDRLAHEHLSWIQLMACYGPWRWQPRPL